MSIKPFLYLTITLALMVACKTETKKISQKKIQFITIDPGHFHAALVQKNNYPEVDSTVHIYAPKGDDVTFHLNRIGGFNLRKENPTNWNTILYEGDDFFEKMLSEKKGNVVVLSGNNRKKTEYINKSVLNGLNVLADKPMAINVDDFKLLKETFQLAEQKNVFLYDIMTERYEITSILQRELSMNKAIFGELEKGSPEHPAITKESVHHFYKYVSGNILTRPPWFFDVEQQGEGIVDVTTHLVDLIQWQCFPDQILHEEDVSINSATRTPTHISKSEFEAITKLDDFPDYLQNAIVNDSILAVFCNGEINYKLKDIHAKVSVKWNYMAPEGTTDTHYSKMRGTKAELTIKQGKEQNFKPTLYIEIRELSPAYLMNVIEEFKKLEKKYPGISLRSTPLGWEVVIPESYKNGHEAHFSQVTEKFIEYLTKGNIPEWEIPNMITKYYTTTKALEMAKSN
ncbi:putative oxidoreductase C-terminal domain-containing protein [Confluentibacter lentus]|uniref:putative oxidoreductase C-terminal domain-containing protein n=1 Tax=Confluentibacter lentus TaxID=1699412 RepID=UPI000C2902B3|nr:putative oxidoreductase C-terminal domain-containing protein [Confluentibacter lentus]